MKTTHHLGRFATFFKESSLVVQLVIVASGIGIIAGTATVAAMVTTPNSSELSTNITTSESSDVASDTDNQSSTSNEDDQTTDTETTTATPQANETTAQNNTQSTPQNSSNSQQETQPQTPTQPTYTDTYPFMSNCSSNPQQTSTQMDSWGYNKCYSSSYTAWKVQEKFGAAPFNWGDPKNWLQSADNANITRGTTPKLHSVGIQTTGGAGWSVWIEAVNGDGTVDISYYNFNNNLAYGKQYSVNSSAFSSYIYFGE